METRISVNRLRDILLKVLGENGAGADESRVIAEEIIYAQIRGKESHGILMLDSMIKRLSKRDVVITTEKDGGAFALINGNGKAGPIVANYAMDLCVKKAEEYGIGFVAVKNPSPFLTAGYHVWRVASEQKYIAICCSVAKSKVAPHNSSEAIFGTNPLGFAFPTLDYPIVVDMALTNIPAARIKQAAEANEQLPFGVAIDDNGQYTTDPNVALKGALTTFGGYKGSAIATCIELMAGAFLDVKCGKQNGEMRSMLFVVLKPDLFADKQKILKNASNLRHDVQASKPIGDEKPILSGDNAEMKARKAEAEGILLTEQEVKTLKKYAVNL